MSVEEHVLVTAVEEFCLHCRLVHFTGSHCISKCVSSEKEGKKNMQREREREGERESEREKEVCPCLNQACSFTPALCRCLLTSWK